MLLPPISSQHTNYSLSLQPRVDAIYGLCRDRRARDRRSVAVAVFGMIDWAARALTADNGRESRGARSAKTAERYWQWIRMRKRPVFHGQNRAIVCVCVRAPVPKVFSGRRLVCTHCNYKVLAPTTSQPNNQSPGV